MVEANYPTDNCYFCQKKLSELTDSHKVCEDSKNALVKHQYNVFYDADNKKLFYISLAIGRFEFLFYYQNIYNQSLKNKTIITVYNSKNRIVENELIVDKHLYVTRNNYLNILEAYNLI